MGLTCEVNGQLFVAVGGRVLKSGQSINSHSKWRRVNSHLIVFRLMRLYSSEKGGWLKKKTRLVCGPSNPVVWYTAPLKLTVVFIVALEISLVKLKAWPVNQGCLSLPAAHSPAPNPVCVAHMKNWFRWDEAGIRVWEWAGGRVVWGYSCLCECRCVCLCMSIFTCVCIE